MKITVDEPLISTDVDHLIRTIAERKKVPLNELRETCNIDKKNLDKWISVLEDEGYIAVEYGIRGTYVHWKSDVDASEGYVKEPTEYEEPVEEYEPVPDTESHEPEPPQEEEHAETVEEEPAETKFSQEEPLEEQEEPDPEELLSHYLAKKREGQSPDAKNIRSNILSNLEDERPSEAPSPEEPSEKPEELEEEVEEPLKPAGEPEEHEEPDVPEAPDDSDDSEDAGIDFSKFEDEEESEPEETLKPTAEEPERVEAADIRALMSSYVQEINREKQNIANLKKEKDNLYREKFASLEGRMQADLVALTERIIERQNRIANLKEAVLELPDKIDEVERVQEQMDKLKEESQDALARTRQKAEAYISHVIESRDGLKERVDEVESSIREQSKRMADLERTTISIDSRSEKIRNAVERSKAQVEAMNREMTDLESDLTRLDEMKSDVEDMKDAIRDTVAGHGEELASLENELEEIGKVEQWVAEYIRDYESKIGDIERYVSRSDEELQDLKHSAESLYMKKYLGELAHMTDDYEEGIEEAATEEKDIDLRMSESKERIAGLLKESREMMKKLQGEVADDDYSSVLAKVKRRTARAKKVVEEKSQEREKLVEDAVKTRKSKRSEKTKRAKAKVKSKPKSKKKKK